MQTLRLAGLQHQTLIFSDKAQRHRVHTLGGVCRCRQVTAMMLPTHEASHMQARHLISALLDMIHVSATRSCPYLRRGISAACSLAALSLPSSCCSSAWLCTTASRSASRACGIQRDTDRVLWWCFRHMCDYCLCEYPAVGCSAGCSCCCSA